MIQDQESEMTAEANVFLPSVNTGAFSKMMRFRLYLPFNSFLLSWIQNISARDTAR